MINITELQSNRQELQPLNWRETRVDLNGITWWALDGAGSVGLAPEIKMTEQQSLLPYEAFSWLRSDLHRLGRFATLSEAQSCVEENALDNAISALSEGESNNVG